MKPHLLLIDNDRELQAQIRQTFAAHYELSIATDRASALDAFRATKPMVVLLGLDPTSSDPEALATLEEMLVVDAQVKVIVVGTAADNEILRRALSLGAYDRVHRPVDLEELKLVLRRSFHLGRVEREFREMRARIQHDSFEGMLGTSPQMRTVFETIRKVATTDVPILILGEKGTGKEMTARAIHQRSLRGSGPFVAINCNAVAENLFAGELFGRENAGNIIHKGRIELANGGTLFLDEIGKMPLSVQIRMVRFFQDQAIERVHGHQRIPVDIRVIAADDGPLDQAIQSGSFREDLFYHLAVVQIVLPPLRERGEDIELLAHYFRTAFAGANGKSAVVFHAEGLQAIRRYSWPGNVRELQNRIRRAVIMCNGRQITATDLQLGLADSTITLDRGTLRAARGQVEREMLRQALRRHSGNISAAAAELGISRPTLYDLMVKLGVEREP